MTDMDFDELDRAVSSLMTKHQAGRPVDDTPPKPQDDETVLELDSDVLSDNTTHVRDAVEQPVEVSTTDTVVTTAPTDQVESDSQAEAEKLPEESHETKLLEAETETETEDHVAPVAENTPTTSSRINLPSRRSGRFMDVVHPSSDMRTDTSSPVRPTAASPRPTVSRTGLTLDPTFTQSSNSAPASDTTAADSTAVTDTDLVDPSESLDDTTENLNTSIQAELNQESSYSSDVSNTPFLTDAKVEKRPLGGAQGLAETSDESETQATPEAPAGEGYKAESQEDDTQTAPSRVVQAELRSDLISLESDDTSASYQTPTDDAAKGQPVITPDSEADTKQQVVAQPDATPLAQPVGPIAITQQYKQEPSSSPTESGSIYDTADYHQPLAHPQKKSSGWMWVVWVLVLLVLGAGSGAAAYFLLIQ